MILLERIQYGRGLLFCGSFTTCARALITYHLSSLAASTRLSLERKSLPRMEPNFAESRHTQIRDMILSDRPAEIADVVDCSKRSVFAI